MTQMKNSKTHAQVLQEAPERLREMESTLLNEIEAMRGELKTFNLQAPDPVDAVAERKDYDEVLAKIDRKTTLLSEVRDSLKALHEDEYGYCASCGREIAPGRLEARPTATVCVDCAEIKEVHSRMHAPNARAVAV